MHYVFVHGLGQNFSSWNKIIESLNLDLNVSCPDLFTLLGNTNPTYENLYHEFKGYCDNLRGPLNLCGISLGAILSLNYTIDRPDKVTSLVLIGAQYKVPKLLFAIQNCMFYFMPKAVFLKMGVDKKQVIGLTKSMTHLNFTKELVDITCDSLIVCGEKDFANKRAAEKLNTHISNSKYLLIKGGGHELNKDHSGELSYILDRFWSKEKK